MNMSIPPAAAKLLIGIAIFAVLMALAFTAPPALS
jgi:hypothetical protein